MNEDWEFASLVVGQITNTMSMLFLKPDFDGGKVGAEGSHTQGDVQGRLRRGGH